MEKLVSSRPNPDRNFWKNRRVLLTGHSGFKGAWAAIWLDRLGAEVHGLALPPDSEPSLWEEAGSALLTTETMADIRDPATLEQCVERVRPQIVLHMAAQALVRPSFVDPLGTIQTNVMGTANLLQALRGSDGLEAVLIITTDKVYADAHAGRDFIESDPLGGDDPYSASKAAAEILTRSYALSFFDPANVPVATARAGNVIGGGDWSLDRLVPDVWRAAQSGEPLLLRDPDATRPWQHVIEPLAGYFLYVEALRGNPATPRALNFGPRPGRPMTVAEVASAVGAGLGFDLPWVADERPRPPERKLLSLDPALAGASLGWEPRLDYATSIAWTADWYARHRGRVSARDICLDQIDRYEALA